MDGGSIMGALVIVAALVVVGVIVLVIVAATHDWKCTACGRVFPLSAWHVLFALHKPRAVLATCPACGVRTYATAVSKRARSDEMQQIAAGAAAALDR